MSTNTILEKKFFEELNEKIESEIEEYESSMYIDYKNDFSDIYFDVKNRNAFRESFRDSNNNISELDISRLMFDEAIFSNNIFTPSIDLLVDDLLLEKEYSDIDTKSKYFTSNREKLDLEVDKRCSQIFEESFKSSLSNCGKVISTIGINKNESFNEGASEIYLKSNAPISIAGVDNDNGNFYQLLATLKIPPENVYRFIEKKYPDIDEDLGRDYLNELKEDYLNPDNYLEYFENIELDLTKDQIEERLENLDMTISDCYDYFEPVIIRNTSIDDLHDLDFSKDVTFENSVIGLIDHINGSGSFFYLDGPVTIKANDNEELSSNLRLEGEYGYGVDDIFGLCIDNRNEEYFEPDFSLTEPVPKEDTNLSLGF